MAMPSIDMSPPLPSGVKAQMGPSTPFAGVGDMLAKQNGAPPTAQQPDAQGALKAQADAVKKVLEQMASASGAGKQFFSRASQLVDQGLAVESQKGPGTPATPQPDSQGGPEGAQAGGMTAPPMAFPG
jgi:hypothetical protein